MDQEWLTTWVSSVIGVTHWHHNHNDGHGAGSSDTIDGESSGNIYPGNRYRTPPSYSADLNKSTTRWGRGGPHLSLRWSRGLSVCIARLVKWSI